MSDLQQRLRTLDETEGECLRQAHERGELEHLYGRPLELPEDPEWRIAKLVKDAGFTHPALERARELEAPRQAAAVVIERLRRRHTWLVDPASGCTGAQASEFNEWRLQTLANYRDRLEALNRAVRDFNLGVPEVLHERPVPLDSTLAAAAQALPPLPVPTRDPERRSRSRFRFCRRRGPATEKKS